MRLPRLSGKPLGGFLTDTQAVIVAFVLYAVSTWLEARAKRGLASDDRTALSANERAQDKVGQFPLLIVVSAWAAVEYSVLSWQAASIAAMLALAAYLAPLAWATTRLIVSRSQGSIRVGMFLLAKAIQVAFMGVMLSILFQDAA